MPASLRGLPLAELHLHIEGTLEPEMVFRLAERNGIALPWQDVAELRRAYDFADLSDFLDLYYRCTAVLRTAQDFTDLCVAYLRRAVGMGVAHAEIFFDPQAHIVRGVGVDTVLDGLLAGFAQVQAEADLTGGFILCFLRDRAVSEALAVLSAVAPRAHQLLAVGLDSAEAGHPPELFEEVFAAARRLGLRTVAHAGEEGPASYISGAIDALGASRIDHGIAAAADAAVRQRLRDGDIALTVCPLSNQRLRVTPDLRTHPLPQLLADGVRVTVNSDDPAYFGGYLDANFAAIEAALGLDAEQLRTLARNGIRSCFASEARRAQLLARYEGADG